MPEAENHVLSGSINDSWRAWLMTGTRRTPADRRRLRGEYRGLKRMLLEGMPEPSDRPHAWNDFSGAMVRHAVDEAMRSLPTQDKQVVKLAYFGGYSNREIADEIGLTEATVQRRLRRALSAISDHIQHGRMLGRRAAFAVGAWLSGRWMADSAHHLGQAAAVAAVTVIVAAQPAPTEPSNPAPVAPPRAHAAQPLPGAPSIPSGPAEAPVQVNPSAVQLPVTVPAVPPLPPLPPLPVKVKTPAL
jgi:RNA polymerase sigma factor (sigma-70 family)